MNFLLRKGGYLTLFVMLAVFAAIVLRGPQGIPVLMEKRREIRVLQEQNADLQNDNDRKRDRIVRLNDSQAEQELEIRNRLKLLRKGETSFILPEPSPEQPKATQ
ncbi:MAG: septum formation initiator family protein [Bryobacteraceae bacterium]